MLHRAQQHSRLNLRLPHIALQTLQSAVAHIDTVIYLLLLPFVPRNKVLLAFLLFLEPPSPDPLEIPADAPEHKNERPERRKWNVWDFAERYGLKLVGANFLTLRAADSA
jgi:hypothetical protein